MVGIFPPLPPVAPIGLVSKIGIVQHIYRVFVQQVVEEEALEHLLNLSPIEVKTLLFYVLSGKEFGLSVQSTRRHSLTSMETVSIMGNNIAMINANLSLGVRSYAVQLASDPRGIDTISSSSSRAFEEESGL